MNTKARPELRRTDSEVLRPAYEAFGRIDWNNIGPSSNEVFIELYRIKFFAWKIFQRGRGGTKNRGGGITDSDIGAGSYERTYKNILVLKGLGFDRWVRLLHLIARNGAIDVARHAKRNKSVSTIRREVEPPPVRRDRNPVGISIDDLRELINLDAVLSEHTDELLSYFLGGLSQKEVAAACNTTSRNFRRWEVRLRKILEERGYVTATRQVKF